MPDDKSSLMKSETKAKQVKPANFPLVKLRIGPAFH